VQLDDLQPERSGRIVAQQHVLSRLVRRSDTVIRSVIVARRRVL
jgi:hypothetical protein